jgi:hypothetical protein
MTDENRLPSEKSEGNRCDDSIALGTHLGYEVHIAISQDPQDAPVPQDYGVNLYVRNTDGENVDIARVDTAHAGCHIDRFYLPEGHNQRLEDYGVSFKNPESAVGYMTDNSRWKDWVERYQDNHGLP